MKCYKHMDVDAVGICKYCHKGLCIDCSTNLVAGLSCHEHMQFVQGINYIGNSSDKRGLPRHIETAFFVLLLSLVGFLIYLII